MNINVNLMLEHVTQIIRGIAKTVDVSANVWCVKEIVFVTLADVLLNIWRVVLVIQ